MFQLFVAFLALLKCSIGLAEGKLVNSKIAISGWLLPELDLKKVPSWLGDDPVLGRLICPPITRLNLKSQINESLFFNKIQVYERDNKVIWHYEPKNGIYWWNGEAVTYEDLRKFFLEHLPLTVSERSGGLWKLPRFEIETSSEGLMIKWLTKPNFGPYILNGVPLNKDNTLSNNMFSYMCAGVYVPQQGDSKKELILVPTPGYKLNRPLLHFYLSQDFKDQQNFFRFKWANTHSVSADSRHPARPVSCKQLVHTPWVSGVIWQDGDLSSQQAIRQILTQMIPRGALLRAGAGSWGELISSLIPRSHPGYDQKVLVRSYGLEEGRKTLISNGYYSKRGQSKLFNQKGEKLSLGLMSLLPEETGSLVEKIVFDSYNAVGIDAFVTKNLSEAQGILAGVYLPLPQLDFLADMHSQAALGIFKLKDVATHASFHQLLAQYSQSLSFQHPDFTLLKAIHRILFDLEPISIIIQHQVCLEASSQWKLANIEQNDPDWFRKIIL